MLNDETRRKLRLMKLDEFIDVLELHEQDETTQSLSFCDRFQQMVDSVYQRKHNAKVEALIKSAKFRLPKADVHDVFYHQNRLLNRNLMGELSACRFVDEHKSVIIQGYTSSGKTYLGCALGKEACRKGHKTRYIRVPDLLMEFDDSASVPSGKEKTLKKYAAFRVLILDEWLIQDLSKKELEFLFELSERRFDSSSTIFCTLYRKEEWLKRLGKGAYAESLVERYSHNVYTVETGEMNMRAKFSGSK